MKTTILRGGRIIDPASNRDEPGDIYMRAGKLIAPDPGLDAEARIIAIAPDQIVCPGLIDLHVHLREPGQSAKETLATGTRAAAAGGFTSVVCMPNTAPAADSPSVISWIQERAGRDACVNVFPTGAITKGLAGEELAPIGSMFKAGVVALTDDGHCVQNHELMRRALEYARMFGLPVLDHCQDYNLVGKGVVHEGYWSAILGLPGWPAAGEEVIVMRNVLLAQICDSHIHCQHLSSAGSVRILREARSRGVRISGEVCPHHIALTDEAVRGFDSNFKMNPPLRTEHDVEALIEGIADGTVDILASDHAPHCSYEKEVEFDAAPFGILGLETELALFLDILVHKKRAIDLPRLISMLTVNPARLLNLPRGTLSIGAAADVTVIDPGLEWTVDAQQFQSKSRNTPFHGWPLRGRAIRTIVGGETVWQL